MQRPGRYLLACAGTFSCSFRLTMCCRWTATSSRRRRTRCASRRCRSPKPGGRRVWSLGCARPRMSLTRRGGSARAGGGAWGRMAQRQTWADAQPAQRSTIWSSTSSICCFLFPLWPQVSVLFFFSRSPKRSLLLLLYLRTAPRTCVTPFLLSLLTADLIIILNRVSVKEAVRSREAKQAAAVQS